MENQGSTFIPAPFISKTDKNRLFPVFLKLEELELLVVGAGKVGLEKLTAVLHNAPATSITVVATEISDGVRNLADNYPRVKLIRKRLNPMTWMKRKS